MQPQVRLQDIRKVGKNHKKAPVKRKRRTVTRSIKSLINTVPGANTPVLSFPTSPVSGASSRVFRVAKKDHQSLFTKRG